MIVNGRFLAGTPTGLHRTARSLLDAAERGGLDVEVRRPPAGGSARAHLWEQVQLPARAGDRPILSLANTAPVAARRAAVLVHDVGPLVGPHWFRPAMQVYARAVVAAARRADVVGTVSSQVAGELVARGVAAERVHVVRPAVDDDFAPATDAAVAALGRHRPYLLVVGWADPRKDARTAALAHLLAVQRRDHDLVLVGLAHRNFAPVDVPEAPTIERAGYVDEPTLRALLTGAAALVYPSRYEGFGLPPLEAWSCGTPAIVGDTPAVRESTEGRATYVAPGDVSALADAMAAAVDGELEVPKPPVWSWDDAAGQLLDALAPLR